MTTSTMTSRTTIESLKTNGIATTLSPINHNCSSPLVLRNKKRPLNREPKAINNSKIVHSLTAVGSKEKDTLKSVMTKIIVMGREVSKRANQVDLEGTMGEDHKSMFLYR